MGYLEDLIKAKLVQLGDTTLKTVAPIVRHARTRAKVTREAEEGTNRLWQLRTLPKVIQQDNRTTTQKTKDRKEADEKHLLYQQQLNELKATEGFNNLLKLTSPSTYVEAATGLQLTPAGKLATDILAFGIAGGAKSLLTRRVSKAISSPSIIRITQSKIPFSQRTLGLVKGISGEIPTTPAEWTAAQDAAIAKGDMTEAQRLRDLHAGINGYGPTHEYHGSNKSFKEFKESPHGIYFTPDKSAAESYARGFSPTKYDVYLNSGDDIVTIDNGGLPWNKIPETRAADAFGVSKEDLHSIVGRYNIGAQPWYYDYLYLFGFRPKTNYYAIDQLAEAAKQQGKTSLNLANAVDNGKKITAIKNKLYDQHIVFKPNQIKSADAVTYDDNGVRIPLGERDNFDINDIRWFSTRPITRASKIHLTRNNPLQTRLARLREHTRYGFTPETNLGLMITPRIRSHYVKAFAKQIDPNLTEELLNLIVQIAYANGRGMHIPIGNNAGETIGGLSIVDIQNAIKYLKLSGIKDVTPNDIGIIAGHEAGHGVLISPAAKRAIEGFSEPDEFYTRAGQVLDAAGIKSTENKRILFNQFMNMIDDYLSKGNLDNGVSEIRDFLRSKTKAVDRQNIMKHINELSSFSGTTYLGSKYYEKKIH